MRLGQEALLALQAEVTGKLLAGDELVVVGEIALSGTELLLNEYGETLSGRFSRSFLRQSREKCQRGRAIKKGEAPRESLAWKMAEEAGAHALYAMGAGGFLCGLWKTAEASQAGLSVDLRRVPIFQETIEICEQLQAHPYRLQAEGALLVGIPGGHALAEAYRRAGFAAAVIGEATSSNDRLLYSGENVRFLERPPRQDRLGEDKSEGANQWGD